MVVLKDGFGRKGHIDNGYVSINDEEDEELTELKEAGLVFSGMSPDGMLSEIIELPHLDWFVATQFHPEFKSRPERPHPLFRGLINAAVKNKK